MLVTGVGNRDPYAIRNSDLYPLRNVDSRPKEENAFRSLNELFKTLGVLDVIRAVLRAHFVETRNRYVLFSNTNS